MTKIKNARGPIEYLDVKTFVYADILYKSAIVYDVIANTARQAQNNHYCSMGNEVFNT